MTIKPSYRRLDARRAFTLIELLVVISILSLLISILLPSLHKSRLQARALHCASNLHALSHALQIYATEYNSAIPRDIDGGPDKRTVFAVPLVEILDNDIRLNLPLWRQFGEIKQLQCPDFPMDTVDPLTSRMLTEQTLDYVANGFAIKYVPDGRDAQLPKPDPKARWQSRGRRIDPETGEVEKPPAKLTDLKNISGIIYLAEANRYMPPGDQGGQYDIFVFHDVWTGEQLPRGRHPRVAVDMRHPGGINLGFFDGHVDRRLPAVIKETDWYFPAY